jgi:hypothetical protein
MGANGRRRVVITGARESSERSTHASRARQEAPHSPTSDRGESEIASAGGVPPPAIAVAKRIVPAVVVQPRELRSQRSLEFAGHAGA